MIKMIHLSEKFGGIIKKFLFSGGQPLFLSLFFSHCKYNFLTLYNKNPVMYRFLGKDLAWIGKKREILSKKAIHLKVLTKKSDTYLNFKKNIIRYNI